MHGIFGYRKWRVKKSEKWRNSGSEHWGLIMIIINYLFLEMGQKMGAKRSLLGGLKFLNMREIL